MTEKKSKLRKAMSELDYAIPEYVFDSEEGEQIHNLIQKVWDEIDNLEYEDMTWESLAEQGHSPRIIESILAKQEISDDNK